MAAPWMRVGISSVPMFASVLKRERMNSTSAKTRNEMVDEDPRIDAVGVAAHKRA